jgi:hypothetical protein
VVETDGMDPTVEQYADAGLGSTVADNLARLAFATRQSSFAKHAESDPITESKAFVAGHANALSRRGNQNGCCEQK